MSDTPRTDSNLGKYLTSTGFPVVDPCFTRQLERELQQWKEYAQRLEEAGEWATYAREFEEVDAVSAWEAAKKSKP